MSCLYLRRLTELESDKDREDSAHILRPGWGNLHDVDMSAEFWDAAKQSNVPGHLHQDIRRPVEKVVAHMLKVIRE